MLKPFRRRHHGGRAGAFAYSKLDAGQLSRVLGGLLLLTALAEFTGLAARWRPQGAAVALLGLGSGFFGGIAGNRRLRAAARSSFDLPACARVGTSTYIGLLVAAPVRRSICSSPGFVFGGSAADQRRYARRCRRHHCRREHPPGLPRYTFVTLVASIGLLGPWLRLT